MTKFFNGSLFAKKKDKILKKRVEELKSFNIVPKLVSIIIGDERKSHLYQQLKKKAAERIGARLDIKCFSVDVDKSEVIKEIRLLNDDKSIHGIMIQLPLPTNFSDSDRIELIDSIDPKKDIDGMREESAFIAPVVKAVLNIMPEKNSFFKIAVLGANGFEGRKIVKRLQVMGYENIFKLDITDKDIKIVLIKADIIISVTGQPDLIKADMIKNGVYIIDVGSPKGDVLDSCYEKASFISPVPGGIGPATISFLMENLIIAATFLLNN